MKKLASFYYGEKRMDNLFKVKMRIVKAILQFSADEMYEYILGGEPMCKSLCKYCVPIYGECIEDTDGDEECRPLL